MLRGRIEFLKLKRDRGHVLFCHCEKLDKKLEEGLVGVRKMCAPAANAVDLGSRRYLFKDRGLPDCT